MNQLNPDVVIVATGSRPVIPGIPGAEGNNVVTVHDVLTFKVTTGHKVVVAAGAEIGRRI